MSALENAKNGSSQDVLNKVQEANLSEYGLCAQPLFDRLMAAKEESAEEQKELGVVAALNNADTEHVLLTVLERTAGEGNGSEFPLLLTRWEQRKNPYRFRKTETELLESLKETAEKYGVELVSGIVNVRAAKGSAVLHIVTVKNLADLFDGCYEDSVICICKW